ncbi:acylglycerol kinase, mitochondrial [Plakobranchus ocellatus]|uniref:Acylglycerol kinase, mitochondrial n=1 Tax=Plakobranchus ocellatus TaxID=259542 RepID=A0AAV4BDY9_9GAST|nr:acylglycerol kinase, mitochondrial [Plakobranchus ocellatus]
MAFVVKTAKTLRTHWKKSLFFSGLAAYGIKFVYDRHNDNLLRRRYCEEAKRYGDDRISLGHRPRRVTVFLNPAANGGKARKLFEKTAAPILYVAGLEVNVVPTEYEGQVKGFMSVLDTTDTDAVVVAGGNGTLLEAVTGFLRKEDRDFRENIPVGVIPLGSSNRFSKIMFGHDHESVKAVAEAAIAVVRAVTKKVDVIKFDGGGEKVIYGLTGLEMGAFRDAEERKAKYWYFGPLKSRWTYLRTAMKEWPPLATADLSYIQATPENMAYEDEEAQGKAQKKKLGWSFTDFLFGRRQTYLVQEQALKAKLAEEEEKQRIEEKVSTTELTLTTTTLANPKASLNALLVKLGPVEPTKTEVIQEGWDRINRSAFKMGSDGDQTRVVKTVEITPSEETEWYNIDGESFEAMKVNISLLQKKLNFFCPSEVISASR